MGMAGRVSTPRRRRLGVGPAGRDHSGRFSRSLGSRAGIFSGFPSQDTGGVPNKAVTKGFAR